jgi:hypothetical protein
VTRDEASARTCQWRQDEHNGIWHSACGPMWPFEEGGPRENGCTYCPRCGGVIEVYAGSFAGWLAAVVEQNTPIAPRDDTAELVEFLERIGAFDENLEAANSPELLPCFNQRLYDEWKQLSIAARAVLARVKEAP